MLRKLGIGISYLSATVYILSILLPLRYCYQHHWCNGPGDAFMSAFAFTPLGAMGTALSLRNAVQQIRKGQPWSWVFWPLAVVFAIVLLGVMAVVALFV